MTKQALIVVHGMGDHTEESVKKTVEESFTKAFGLYSSLAGVQVSQKFDIVAVSYNKYFEDFRQQAAEEADNMLDTLASTSGSMPITVELAKMVGELDKAIGEDKFFATHWLDVLLYRFSLLSEPIRLDVAEVLADEIIARGSANVHVLGHSLGTAVVHDTLAKAYGAEPLIKDGRSLKLLNTRDRLAGVHMAANVSRVLQSFRKVGASEVRPGTGCCGSFFEYRHKLDPFTKVKPFDPTDNQEWVPHDVFRKTYHLIEPSTVTAANVHGLDHYLAHPDVHLLLFRQLFGFRPRKTEREAAMSIYLQDTVQAKAAGLRDALDGLELTEESVNTLLNAGIALKDVVEGFGEKFK